MRMMEFGGASAMDAMYSSSHAHGPGTDLLSSHSSPSH
jgi:hypothetical protein